MASKTAWAAIIAGVAATAAFLSNVETLLSKPESILTKAGILSTPPVALTVRLADLTAKQKERLVFGSMADDMDDSAIDFLDYSQVGDEFCLSGKPMDLCGNAPKSLHQPPYWTIDYAQGDNTMVGPWGPAIPIFDIVSVRRDERDILLTTQKVEYELIRPDRRPYLQIMGNDNGEGTFTLVRQSAEPIAKVEIRYKFADIIPRDRDEAWYRKKKDSLVYSGFDQSLTLDAGFFRDANALDGPSDDSAPAKAYSVDIRKAITGHFPGSQFVPYKNNSPDWAGLKWLSGVTASTAFNDPNAESDAIAGDPPENAVMIVGHMRVTSTGGEAYDSDFVLPVILSSTRGYGAGGVSVDSHAVFPIGDQPKGAVSKPINLVLNDASPTIRSQVALMFQRSGLYRIRFLFGTNESADYMASPWITVQAFAPPAFVEAYSEMQAAGRSGGE